MKSLKQLGKQLGLIVLMSSSIFSISSVKAQTVDSEIVVNVDVIYETNYLKCLLSPSCNYASTFDVVTIGGRLNLQSFPDITKVAFGRNLLVDPFLTNYFNNRNVGGSNTYFNDYAGGPRFPLDGTFNEKSSNNKLTLDLNLSSDNTNGPAFPYNNTTCKDTNGCMLFHYGYSEEITSLEKLTPSFFQTLLYLRDNNGSIVKSIKNMATPIVTTSREGVTRYLIMYHEQRDPANNGVVIGVWTEFSVNGGGSNNDPNQLPKISYSTKSLEGKNSVNISNTEVFLSEKKIPLAQLNRMNLPPTDLRFTPIPKANGTIAPGIETTPVNIK